MKHILIALMLIFVCAPQAVQAQEPQVIETSSVPQNFESGVVYLVNNNDTYSIYCVEVNQVATATVAKSNLENVFREYGFKDEHFISNEDTSFSHNTSIEIIRNNGLGSKVISKALAVTEYKFAEGKHITILKNITLPVAFQKDRYKKNALKDCIVPYLVKEMKENLAYINKSNDTLGDSWVSND